MAYDVYPYSYRSLRFSPQQAEEIVDFQQQEQKRGDLEGYLAAKNFASQAYSASVSSNAQANIRQLNRLRHDITSREYINILIKQGQVPEKHFKYQQNNTKEIVTELNSSKDIVKQVIFDNDTEAVIPVISRYYNPDTGLVVKEVQYYKDGNIKTKNFDNFKSEIVESQDNSQPPEILNYATSPAKTENPFGKI